jgi:hypothetical protein
VAERQRHRGTMKLPDQLHCSHCKGRLAAVSVDALRCTGCERIVPIVDGITDFAADALPSDTPPARHRDDPLRRAAITADLFAKMQTAAGNRWPGSLGDLIELGCDHVETTHSIIAAQGYRSLLVLHPDIEVLRACRARVAAPGLGFDRPVNFATATLGQDVIRDAVADTIIGTEVLSSASDVRGFLRTAHRMLKPGGRAAFVVRNRRYHEAICLGLAEALVQRFARDGTWPEGQPIALELVAHARRLLVHRGDIEFLSGLDIKHLFDSEMLEELGREAGFATAEMLPLDPDPAGAETTVRICRAAGVPDSFVETVAQLAAAAGQPFFSLLSRQDASAFMVLWLTKGVGPSVRIFTYYPPPPPIGQVGVEVALGGLAPRWSIELTARDLPDGIVVSVGGWCLCNTGVRWVRLTLDDVIRYVPVWRPRPDVHEVLNRNGLYHPLNTLCSGMASDVVFEGVHAIAGTRPFKLDIVLGSGLIVAGPAPEALVMNELMVIAH